MKGSSRQVKSTGRAFIDTNILVYLYDSSSPKKQQTSKVLLEKLIAEDRANLSTQVVQEFLNVALYKFQQDLTLQDAQIILQDILLPLCRHFPSVAYYQRALALYQRESLSFYDALIVQAALDLDCTHLYSEDMQNGQKFGSLTVINPY